MKLVTVLLLIMLSLACPARCENPRPCAGRLQFYQAVEGDDLLAIARRYRLAVEHLAFANGCLITTIRVRTGTRLVIPTWRVLPANPPASGIVVNLPERGFYLFRNGKLQDFYPISIGDEALEKGRFATPVGRFHIVEKVINPTWYPPAWAKDRRPVGPGPTNPLGERWIGLSLPRTGIHGTNDPMNIGNSLTHGCMRTYPELLREVYDKVEVGWPVRIEYETAKIGRAPDGSLVAVTFPDVYRRQDPVRSLREAMRKVGAGPPGRRNFDDLAALGLGVPFKIAATDTLEEELSHSAGEWGGP